MSRHAARGAGAPPPTSRPTAGLVAMLLALLLVALAVLGVRELAASQGWAGGTPWLPEALSSAGGLQAGPVVTAVGVVVAVVGLLLVVTAALPARRTHVRVHGSGELWLSPDAVAALARTAADRSPGVLASRAVRASRRRVVVDVMPHHDGPADAADAAGRTAQRDVGELVDVSVTVRHREDLR